MDEAHLCRKYGKPLADPAWEIDIPEPDRVLPKSSSQRIPWAQWMKEVRSVSRKHTKPYPRQMDPNRFVLD